MTAPEPVEWARCNECGGEVWFDAWATLSNEVAASFDNTHCEGCGGPVGYCWEATTDPMPEDDSCGSGFCQCEDCHRRAWEGVDE